MVELNETVVELGAPFVVAILWVMKGYILSVYRGEKKFKVGYAGKTLLLGVVAGGISGLFGGDVAFAATVAVPFVDDFWNRFSSTWNKLEDLPTVDRFEAVANDLLLEYGDDAAEKMDETRRRVTGRSPTDSSMANLGDAASSAGGAVSALSDSMDETSETTSSDEDREAPSAEGEFFGDQEESSVPSAAEASDVSNKDPRPGNLINRKLEAIPDNREGYQILRSVARYIPAVNGVGNREGIETQLREYGDPYTVLDAFESANAMERAKRIESGGD